MAAGEFDFIREHLLPLTRGDAAALELSDDAAVLEGLAAPVLASDMLVEGRHFLTSDGPAVAATRALGSNLSDLAAMGAVPRGFLCSIAWPDHYAPEDRVTFVEAMARAAATYRLPLLGGDTTSGSSDLVVSLTVIGDGSGGVLHRKGAQVGDDVWVSGTIGDAVLGLSIAKGELDTHALLLERYQNPRPRLELGQALHGLASACIDISDGLVADAGHIADAAGVGIEIETALMPWSAPVLHWLENEGQAGVETLIAGGDDYELLFTAPHEKASQVLALSREIGVELTWIGRVTEGAGVRVLDDAGEPIAMERGGFTHF